MEEGKIVQWCKAVGETFNEGEDDVTRIALMPRTGIDMVGDQFSARSRGMTSIEAEQAVTVTSPHVSLGGPAADAPYLWLDEASKKVKLSAANSTLALKDGAIDLQSKTINIGNPSAPNPLHMALTLQKKAAKDAYESAYMALFELLGTPGEAAGLQAADKTFAVLQAVRKQLQDVDPTLDVPVLNGLKVDDEKSVLSFLASSVKTAGDGVTIGYGTSILKVDAMGLSGSGPLIKLG